MDFSPSAALSISISAGFTQYVLNSLFYRIHQDYQSRRCWLHRHGRHRLHCQARKCYHNSLVTNHFVSNTLADPHPHQTPHHCLIYTLELAILFLCNLFMTICSFQHVVDFFFWFLKFQFSISLYSILVKPNFPLQYSNCLTLICISQIPLPL